MGRRLLRCRNRSCPCSGQHVLGRVTEQNVLVVSSDVASLRVYLDVGRADIRCPACGAVRSFRGAAVLYG